MNTSLLTTAQVARLTPTFARYASRECVGVVEPDDFLQEMWEIVLSHIRKEPARAEFLLAQTPAYIAFYAAKRARRSVLRARRCGQSQSEKLVLGLDDVLSAEEALHRYASVVHGRQGLMRLLAYRLGRDVLEVEADFGQMPFVKQVFVLALAIGFSRQEILEYGFTKRAIGHLMEGHAPAPEESAPRKPVKGVTWHKHRKAWMARVSTKGGRVVLGYFESPEDAAEAIRLYRGGGEREQVDVSASARWNEAARRLLADIEQVVG